MNTLVSDLNRILDEAKMKNIKITKGAVDPEGGQSYTLTYKEGRKKVTKYGYWRTVANNRVFVTDTGEFMFMPGVLTGK
jgi:uncharacterized protein Veg